MFQIISVVIGFLLLGLDQWSKQWAITHLEGIGTVPVLPGLFDFDFLPNGNDGAAWGIPATVSCHFCAIESPLPAFSILLS